MKLNGTHQLLLYADDVNILGGSVHTIQENAETLVVAGRERGLEEHADKTTYMVKSRDQYAGRSQSTKTDNSSFDRVERVQIFGTTLTHQNSIQGEITSRLKSGNACHQSVQNILSSSSLPRRINIKI